MTLASQDLSEFALHVRAALAGPDTTVRLFGKPAVSGRRRMAVTLALGDDVESARASARRAAEHIRVAG